MQATTATQNRITLGPADLLAVLGLLGIVLALFGDLLFAGEGRALSVEWGDLATQFVHWRRFGAGELARGNLPLWNPHLYAGTPFFGGFQAALLYPPNWLHLLLPLRAEPLPGSAQQHYDVLPGNHVLRAIPLAAGVHRLRLVYERTGLRAGFALSAGRRARLAGRRRLAGAHAIRHR